jgi:hypothetical protein
MTKETPNETVWQLSDKNIAQAYVDLGNARTARNGDDIVEAQTRLDRWLDFRLEHTKDDRVTA